MRSFEQLETLDELEIEFARAMRSYKHEQQVFDQSTFSGNPKIAYACYKALNEAEARAVRLDRAISRCREVLSKNPFMRVILLLREMNEPELAKKLQLWAELPSEVI